MIDTGSFRVVGLAAALLVVAGSAARGAVSAPAATNPAGSARDPAAQAAGLFMQSCVRFAAQPHALRHWAEGRQLAQLPGVSANSFLYGLPGRVYDATTPAGKLVLVSQDGGSCSVVADQANGTALLDRLDADLKAAGITYTITADGPDPQEKALHNRAYDASFGGRRWLMLISTVSGAAGGEAMLTTNP
jgi:hypothetical protein